MKNWIVRVASLYVFNVVVLLAIGLLLPQVRVGWNALWAAVILTLVAMAVKPLLTKVFAGAAAKSASSRTRVGEKTVQYATVFVVELIVWILTVIFSGVNVRGFFWGYVIPPVLLLIAWVIYDQIDDRIEAKASKTYDAIRRRTGAPADAPADTVRSPSPQETVGRNELKDGLTPEQRRLFDEL